MAIPTVTIISDWEAYSKELIKQIKETYSTVSEKRSSSGVVTLIVYTDDNRVAELKKLIGTKPFFSPFPRNSAETTAMRISASINQKSSKSTTPATTATVYVDDSKHKNKRINILLKPIKNYGGSGKANELAFQNLMETIRSNSVTNITNTKTVGAIHYTLMDGRKNMQTFAIDSDTVIQADTKNNKTDIIVGDIHVSLKDANAEYVASLNSSYPQVAHTLLRELYKKKGDSAIEYNDGTYITINDASFPYSHISDQNTRNFILFGTGSTSREIDIPDVPKNDNVADVVIVHDFKNRLDLYGNPLYTTEDKEPIVKMVSRIIRRHTDASGKYNIIFYLRNAREKGSAFGSKITTFKELETWLNNNKNKVPKGLRLLAVFITKKKSEDTFVVVKL